MTTKPKARVKSEARYLAAQAADAKEAVTHGLRDLAKTLSDASDIRSHAKRHPWIVIGSAIVAGFVTGACLSSPARNDGGDKTEPEPQPIPEPAMQQASKSFLLSTLGTVIVGILTTTLQRSMTAFLSRLGSTSGGPANERATSSAASPEKNSVTP